MTGLCVQPLSPPGFYGRAEFMPNGILVTLDKKSWPTSVEEVPFSFSSVGLCQSPILGERGMLPSLEAIQI